MSPGTLRWFKKLVAIIIAVVGILEDDPPEVKAP